MESWVRRGTRAGGGGEGHRDKEYDKNHRTNVNDEIPISHSIKHTSANISSPNASRAAARISCMGSAPGEVTIKIGSSALVSRRKRSTMLITLVSRDSSPKTEAQNVCTTVIRKSPLDRISHTCSRQEFLSCKLDHHQLLNWAKLLAGYFRKILDRILRSHPCRPSLAIIHSGYLDQIWEKRLQSW